jgi:endonuclease/exonuclease/phosphatase family metal-dependent hydrolase
MKLISFNIAIMIDNSQKVINFVNQINPDIVCFQEIIRHLDNSVYSRFKSKAKIENSIKLPYSFFGPQWIANADIKNGKICKEYGGFLEQGNEVLSKYPIVAASNEFFHRKYELSIDRTNFYTEDHARCVEVVEIMVENKKIQILNLHGTWSKDCLDSQRSVRQSRYIIQAAQRKNIPTIITGDFNLLPDTESIKMFNKNFVNLIKKYKIKTTRPKKDGYDLQVVDYIFVNDKIKVNSFEVIETDISDHFPLILDFDIILKK